MADLFSTWPGRFGAPAILVSSLALTGAGCQEVTGGPPAARTEVVWRTPVQERFAGTTSVPETDGQRVYVTGTGVAAFDVQSGARVWQTPRFTESIPTHLAVRGGRVFAAEATVWAFDAATGRELWRYTPDSDASLSQSAADERAVYFGTRTRRVYALGAADGAPLWTVRLGADWPHDSPVKGIAAVGDTVYAAIDRHYSPNGFYSAGVIAALDRATGRELWRHQNGTGADSRGIIRAPTVAGRLLLAADHKGSAFYAVDRFTGQEVWRTPTEPGFAGPDSPPVVAAGVAYASGNDAYVYALELATGRVLWRTRPAMGGSVYHAVCGGAVFNNFQGLGILDRQSGAVLGRMFDQEERVTSGFAVHADRIFFLTHRAVYALRCP